MFNTCRLYNRKDEAHGRNSPGNVRTNQKLKGTVEKRERTTEEVKEKELDQESVELKVWGTSTSIMV